MEDLVDAVNVGTFAAALIFVALMSLIPEPARRRFNAVFVAGAGAVYINGGFGVWELAYIALATLVAFKGLSSYPYIGLAWLMHTGWDVMHHFYGTPIWAWAPQSSAGCAVFDALIAVWYFMGAPSVFDWFRRKKPTSAS